MATPEAIFLTRLAQSQEGDQEQRPTREGTATTDMEAEVLRFIFGPERMEAMLDVEQRVNEQRDSLLQLLNTLESQDPLENIEDVFLERLGQLHEVEPGVYPDPEDVEVVDTRFGRLPRLRGTNSEPGPRNLARWQRLWPAVQGDLKARADQERRELLSELRGTGIQAGREQFREMGGGLVDRILQLDQLIREHDPTNPARERVREAPGALGELLRSVGARVGEGAVAAGETLGQGATDLEFLLRQFVLEEIVGSGDAEFPAGNPRAVRAEQFAGRLPRNRGESSRRRR